MTKQKIKNTIFFLCFIFFSQAILAQKTTKVSGTIKDAKTGEALSFVNVYFTGTEIGLTSDLDGNYTIETTETVDSLSFAFLGYNRKSIKIKPGKSQNINVRLSETSHNLDITATVTTKKRRKRVKDTAAIALWRNVVKHWPINRLKAANNYYYKDYTSVGFDWFNPGDKLLNGKLFKKGTDIMRNYLRTEDNGDRYLPVLHKETIQEFAYQDKPKDKLERVLADRFSGIKNESMSDFIGSELDNVNPFETVNVIVGKSFIGPFAPLSNAQYNYFLTDSLEKDGDKYYELTFVGKRKQDFTFLGTAWVHKPTFGVESIEMEISPHIALNHVHTIDVQQEYNRTPEGYWYKIKDDMVMTAKIDFIDIGTRKNKHKKKNQIRVRRSVTRYDLKVNTTFEPKFFAGEEMQWDENAGDRDVVYWMENRPHQLDTISKGVYTMMDAVQKTPFYKVMDYLAYTSLTGHLRAGPIEFGPVPEFVSWNSIEGVRLKLGLRTSNRWAKWTKKVELSTYAAYGFKDKDWKYQIMGKVHLPTSNRKWHMLTGWYRKDFRALGAGDDAGGVDNIINSLLRATPVDNLMMIRDAGFRHEKDWMMGLTSRIGYRWRKFYSVDGGFQFTSGDGLTKIPSFTSSEVRAEVRWRFKDRYWVEWSKFNRLWSGSKHPLLTLSYTGGIKGFLGGDYNYHKLDFTVQHRLSTPIGYTKYQLRAGKIFGDAPYPVLKVHLGNESFMRNASAYALMNDFEFVSDMYGAIWVDHHFDGIIFNTIPGIRKLKWRTVFIFKALYGTLKDSNRNLIDMPSTISAPGFYSEIGFGIDNIFKMVRIDFMWRLTQRNQPGVRGFGVNLTITPKF